MQLVEMQWDPTRRQLRQFAVAAAITLPMFAWLWGASAVAIGVLAAAGAALAAVGLTHPALLKPAFLGMSLLALPIGLVVGELVLITVYFGVFLPVGLVFRLMGRDALLLKLDRRADSYWSAKKQAKRPGDYYHQS